MLTVARDKEKAPELKRPHGRPRKRFIKEVDPESEDKATKILCIILNIDLE